MEIDDSDLTCGKLALLPQVLLSKAPAKVFVIFWKHCLFVPLKSLFSSLNSLFRSAGNLMLSY